MQEALKRLNPRLASAMNKTSFHFFLNKKMYFKRGNQGKKAEVVIVQHVVILSCINTVNRCEWVVSA